MSDIILNEIRSKETLEEKLKYAEVILKDGDLEVGRKVFDLLQSENRKHNSEYNTNFHRVRVIDAPCGYGKTSWAIQEMNDIRNFDKRYIFITPYRNEIKRIKSNTYRAIYTPSSTVNEGMTDSLKRLLINGRDIVTTHALLRRFRLEFKELIQKYNYTLILDKVVDVVKKIELSETSVQLLRNADALLIGDDGICKWNYSKYPCRTGIAELDRIRSYADSGRLNLSNETSLFWEFDKSIFKWFENSYVLTYFFRGQKQRFYFDANNINYRMYSLNKHNVIYNVIPYKERVPQDKLRLKNLIHIESLEKDYGANKIYM